MIAERWIRYVKKVWGMPSPPDPIGDALYLFNVFALHLYAVVFLIIGIIVIKNLLF